MVDTKDSTKYFIYDSVNDEYLYDYGIDTVEFTLHECARALIADREEAILTALLIQRRYSNRYLEVYEVIIKTTKVERD